MAKRQLFTVQTPLGAEVGLARDRWRQIVRFKHPALRGCERLVRDCLQDPLLIRQSAKEAEVHSSYRECDGIFLCVVTAPLNDDTRFVVPAYFTKNIKAGKEVWKK